MSSLIDYNGLEVVNPDPTGEGGRAINDNFKTLSTCLKNVVEDTSPQLGGDLDGQNYSIHSKDDNAKHYFGAEDDASLYYDGTDLVIDPKEVGYGLTKMLGAAKVYRSGAGGYFVIASATDNTAIGDDPRLHFQAGATPANKWTIGVDLSDGDSFAFGSTSLAGTIPLRLTTGGHAKIPGDSQKLYFGEDDDDSIQHDGTDFVLTCEEGTHNLTLSGYDRLDLGSNADLVAASDKAFYLGDPDTNGTWRIRRDGDNLVMERREGGSYVVKDTILASP